MQDRLQQLSDDLMLGYVYPELDVLSRILENVMYARTKGRFLHYQSFWEASQLMVKI